MIIDKRSQEHEWRCGTNHPGMIEIEPCNPIHITSTPHVNTCNHVSSFGEVYDPICRENSGANFMYLFFKSKKWNQVA